MRIDQEEDSMGFEFHIPSNISDIILVRIRRRQP